MKIVPVSANRQWISDTVLSIHRSGYLSCNHTGWRRTLQIRCCWGNQRGRTNPFLWRYEHENPFYMWCKRVCKPLERSWPDTSYGSCNRQTYWYHSEGCKDLQCTGWYRNKIIFKVVQIIVRIRPSIWSVHIFIFNKRESLRTLPFVIFCEIPYKKHRLRKTVLKTSVYRGFGVSPEVSSLFAGIRICTSVPFPTSLE